MNFEFPLESIPEFISEFFTLLTETYMLTMAQNREQVYQDFLQQESGFNAQKLAFLDKGIKTSPYQTAVSDYPNRLTQRPSLALAGAKTYPNVGEVPEIDEQALNFLHPDIKQACVCVGGSAGGPLKARWLGRNALDKEQFWSATKIIPILNLLSQLKTDVQTSEVRGEEKSFSLWQLFEDVVTYEEKIGSSNAIAAMFKCFQTYRGLEEWMMNVTGNRHAEFQGLYGEEPFIASPKVCQENREILSAAPETKKRETQPGENLVTAYDLTRLMSMVGWHFHLPHEAQFSIEWENLKPFIVALGKDISRYLDVAIAKLGITENLQSPVILSKMGFGYSNSRKRTELTYTCFTQFSYKGMPMSVAMTLRGARALGNFDREAVEIDARMATEVTEILRRLVTEEFK